MEKNLLTIRKTLWDLNIPPTYLGAHYLAYAELLILQDQNRLTMVTKWLYPEVARRYRTSWKAVERNIRTVIALCWAQGNGELLHCATGAHLEQRPSPTEFLQVLAHHFLSQPPEFWDDPSTFS